MAARARGPRAAATRSLRLTTAARWCAFSVPGHGAVLASRRQQSFAAIPYSATRSSPAHPPAVTNRARPVRGRRAPHSRRVLAGPGAAPVHASQHVARAAARRQHAMTPSKNRRSRSQRERALGGRLEAALVGEPSALSCDDAIPGTDARLSSRPDVRSTPAQTSASPARTEARSACPAARDRARRSGRCAQSHLLPHRVVLRRRPSVLPCATCWVPARVRSDPARIGAAPACQGAREGARDETQVVLASDRANHDRCARACRRVACVRGGRLTGGATSCVGRRPRLRPRVPDRRREHELQRDHAAPRPVPHGRPASRRRVADAVLRADRRIAGRLRGDGVRAVRALREQQRLLVHQRRRARAARLPPSRRQPLPPARRARDLLAGVDRVGDQPVRHVRSRLDVGAQPVLRPPQPRAVLRRHPGPPLLRGRRPLAGVPPEGAAHRHQRPQTT